MKKTNHYKNRIESLKIKRKEEEERLLAIYVEGKSNIDSDKLNNDDLLALIFSDDLPLKEKEKIIGKPVPLITKEEWFNKEMAEFDKKQPKFPQGKYQDPEEIFINIHQKFFQALRDSSPHIFEDLRKLLPYFKTLYGNATEKYFKIHYDLKAELARLSFDFPEYSPPCRDYYWGETKLLFKFTQLAFDAANSKNSKNVKIPIELENIINNIPYGKELFFRILNSKIDSFIEFVQKAFKPTATNEKLILPNFLHLQSQILNWADRYHLCKDWLIEYAYFILFQMSKNNEIPIKEIPIWARNYDPEIKSSEFVFNFRDWQASKQDAEDYEEELRQAFEEHLTAHLSYTYSNLHLDEQTKFTKPKDFENIKWLIAWNEGASIKQIANCFHKSPSTIDSRIDALKAYNLPKRIGQRGRNKQVIISDERLAEIKAIEIDENLLENV